VQASSLRAANEELESIAYSVSHDLRAPLRSIEGFSTIIMEDYAARMDEEGLDYLNRIRNATTHMSQLIDDVLELSKLSRTSLRRTTVDLTEMATDIVRQLSMEDTSQILEIRIAPGLKAFADAVLCRTLLE